MNKNKLSEKEIIDIRSKMMFYIMNDLVGVATKKMRGITLNYMNDIMDINIIFDDKLTEEEEEEMQQIDTNTISSAYPILYDWQNRPILNIKQMNLNLIVIRPDIPIINKKGNLGWLYLRREY
ncbi:hypothetical protein JMI89_04800 [Frischella sp. Ac48]|uniref:Uncharacterized protein n=1 Tax=Frischella japonica TaxID=2741544 RepID=A0ABR7QUR3_9GAMM|nr:MULTISPECIES: hypothetical protein [Frischella]MBC9129955.1 hypothetical protein [Frischella japonica]MBX4132945.1 hypothetical protein [Frischella sp. Ac48]